eukprot:873235-Heterocapsa_arctica.AAC.1
MSSTEMASLPTAETLAGAYETSDVRSSLPSGEERPDVPSWRVGAPTRERASHEALYRERANELRTRD